MKDISIFGWKQIRDITITLGVGVLGIGLILVMFGADFFPIDSVQWIVSIGLGILALGIAFHSIVISKESSVQITAIANATYLELADVFEDKRIQLLQHPDWLGIEGTVWKCWTYVKRAKKLMEYAEIDDESHTWTTKGTYTVRAKARNTEGNESDWGGLQVIIPRNRATNNVLLWRLLERFPLLQKIVLSVYGCYKK